MSRQFGSCVRVNCWGLHLRCTSRPNDKLIKLDITSGRTVTITGALQAKCCAAPELLQGAEIGSERFNIHMAEGNIAPQRRCSHPPCRSQARAPASGSAVLASPGSSAHPACPVMAAQPSSDPQNPMSKFLNAHRQDVERKIPINEYAWSLFWSINSILRLLVFVLVKACMPPAMLHPRQACRASCCRDALCCWQACEGQRQVSPSRALMLKHPSYVSDSSSPL